MVVDIPTEQLSDRDIDRMFRALGDSTRRDILCRTLAGTVTVTGLADAYDMSFAAVQKHVAVLEGAGLVRKERRGRERLVSGDPAALARVQRLLSGYEAIWRGRIERLDALFAQEE